MDIRSTITLNNQVKIPCFGLGVFQAKNGDEAYHSILGALDAGYRHIDTAAIYGNEESVGKALKDSGIPREEIFVTTKLWNEETRKGTQREAFKQSLKRLGLDYVDLYLMHWPVREKIVESWNIMEEIYKSGGARAIGVSNFQTRDLDTVLASGSVVPAVNQIELHPLLTQEELVDYSKSKGIEIEVWSPLARNLLMDNPVLGKIAEKYDKTIAQVILRWDLDHGYIVFPKSVHKDRIIANSQIFDFHLTPDEIKSIDGLNQNRRTGADPENFPF